MWFYCSFTTKSDSKRAKREKIILHWSCCTVCPFTCILHMVRVMERFTEKTYLALLFTNNCFAPQILLSFYHSRLICLPFFFIFLGFIFHSSFELVVFVRASIREYVLCVCFPNAQWYWAHFRISNTSRCWLIFFYFFFRFSMVIFSHCFATSFFLSLLPSLMSWCGNLTICYTKPMPKWNAQTSTNREVEK